MFSLKVLNSWCKVSGRQFKKKIVFLSRQPRKSGKQIANAALHKSVRHCIFYFWGPENQQKLCTRLWSIAKIIKSMEVGDFKWNFVSPVHPILFQALEIWWKPVIESKS